MHALHQMDVGLFRFINETLRNGFFDWLMPLASGTPGFKPMVAVIAVGLCIWGGRRGRLFVLLLALAIAVTDGWLCNTLKHLIARPRPFLALSGVEPLVGRSGSGSMPSAHAANWAAATFITFLFYRRSWRTMVPLGLLVSFSRVYNGVHYPTDVLVGWIIGAGAAAAVAWTANALWQSAGRRWFPAGFAKVPVLWEPCEHG